jgi:hypothetical protein
MGMPPGLGQPALTARDSEEVLATANELERLVLDLDTGVRGFVLTGEEQVLEPWDNARRNLPARITALERQSAAHPDQKQAARQLAPAADAYVERYAAPLLQAARRGDPAARSVAATLDGKRRVDAMRVQFDAFIATERRLPRPRRGGRTRRRAGRWPPRRASATRTTRGWQRGGYMSTGRTVDVDPQPPVAGGAVATRATPPPCPWRPARSSWSPSARPPSCPPPLTYRFPPGL